MSKYKRPLAMRWDNDCADDDDDDNNNGVCSLSPRLWWHTRYSNIFLHPVSKLSLSCTCLCINGLNMIYVFCERCAADQQHKEMAFPSFRARFSDIRTEKPESETAAPKHYDKYIFSINSLSFSVSLKRRISVYAMGNVKKK